jgi:hypothetical protein
VNKTGSLSDLSKEPMSPDFKEVSIDEDRSAGYMKQEQIQFS